ncbi:hypothetical protein [Diplocloster modestus]|uniref:Uncharacterized protein n=1 Tax=Diplocloster modestus TaxID=2850322 RepID=A0ABS6K164_9FIRM|nr:hypothetical protein [Diplocloster modestus]MBU9724405.1 hypothetical protein [Diplocloster modestus]
MISIGDNVTWTGSDGCTNTGLVIGIDQVGVGTPIYIIRSKNGWRVRIPQERCKKTIP